MDDEILKKDNNQPLTTPTKEPYIGSVPTLDYFFKTYARSSSINDQKSFRIFFDFEASEKVKRLRNELTSVKAGVVKQGVLDEVIGKARQTRYGGYDKWAALALLWLSIKK